MAGQTAYNIDRGIALAGMLADNGPDTVIEAWPASEVIPAGVMCEIVSGAARVTRSTGQDSPTLGGVSVFKGMVEYNAGNGEYRIGDMVPLLRKGRIWGVTASTLTAATELKDASYAHSSTVATDRGKFTDAAPSATATSEVSSVIGKFRGSRNAATPSAGLAKVEINLPSS